MSSTAFRKRKTRKILSARIRKYSVEKKIIFYGDRFSDDIKTR